MHKYLAPLLAFGLILSNVVSQQEPATFASGLNGPMGLLIDPEGNLWVVDSGIGGEDTLELVPPGATEPAALPFGPTSRVIRITPDGTQTEMATLPSLSLGMEVSGANRITWLEGNLFVTSGAWLGEPDSAPPEHVAAVVRLDPATGEILDSIDTWRFEAENNPDGFVHESHPYGITTGDDGALYVADAGANTILRVNPETGEVSLVAVLPGVPGMFPNAHRGGAQENDPVPTGITRARDGALYVALLPGFPPVPGSSAILRITSEGETIEVATGMTVLTDLTTGPDGAFYAVQMAEFTEQGPAPMTGRVLRIEDGEVSDVISGLSFPTALAVDQDGTLFVAVNGVGAPGTGEILEFRGVAAPR